MISIEKIEDSFKLPIKSDEGKLGCPECALLDDFFNNPLYQVCELQQNERRDEKLIFLEKELNKIRRNNNE